MDVFRPFVYKGEKSPNKKYVSGVWRGYGCLRGGGASMRKRLSPSLLRSKRKKVTKKKKDVVVHRGCRTVRNVIFLKVSGCGV